MGLKSTNPNGARSTQLALEATLKGPGVCHLVGVVEVDEARDTENRGDKGANHNETGTRRGPGVVVRGEDAEDVVVFVNGLAKVAALLRVPPVGMGIAVLTLDGGRVDVASVLWRDSWSVKRTTWGICNRDTTV